MSAPQDVLDRMRAELDRLEADLTKLHAFLGSEKSLGLAPEIQRLMAVQASGMFTYLGALQARLTLMEKQ